MSQHAPLVYDSVAKTHTPLANGDTLTPGSIPISARSDNQIQSLSDGLYVGTALANPTYYVAAAGTNSPTSGTSGTPYQTLAYALSQIAAAGLTTGINKRVTLLLKAGESFTLSADCIIDGGHLTIAEYGDTTYGDYNASFGPAAKAYVVAPLNRPTISNVGNNLNSYWACTKFILRNGAKLHFYGVKLSLPNAPGSVGDSSYGTFSDMVTVEDYQYGSLHLDGCIVNKADVASRYGLVGLQARADSLTFSQFASQLLIAGVQVGSGASSDALTSRAFFIKLYADFAGNNQVATSMVQLSTISSPGSSVLRLNWTDTTDLVISGGIHNLPSYPTIADPTYGIKNYFTGLVRDQQSRPLNVISGRLF